MAVAYRGGGGGGGGGGGRAELQRQYWKERSSSPERTLVWTEPRSSMEKKVEVVYYLTRNNGHLDHPHFMELSLPSGKPLYLRDVMRRLNSLRGAGMASMYSWSCKRSYNNGGFVWQDLSPDDFIYPARAHGYVLKGSHLLLCPLQHHKPDSKEWKAYRTSESTVESALRSVDAGTQTEYARKPRRRAPAREEEQDEIEISPPLSSSSNETLQGGGGGADEEDEDQQQAAGGGRMRAPAVLMHLFSCGSISVKSQGTSPVSQLRRRRPVAVSSVNSNTNDHDGDSKRNYNFSATSRLEEREYFSGSLIEMKKNKGSSDANAESSRPCPLRRSASYNTDRSLKLDLVKEIGGVRARCVLRRPKMMVTAAGKGGNPFISGRRQRDREDADDRWKLNPGTREAHVKFPRINKYAFASVLKGCSS